MDEGVNRGSADATNENGQSGLAAPHDFKEVVALLATVTTVAQFFAGMLVVNKIRKLGTVGDMSAIPFLAGAVGCTLWCLYGVALNDDSIKYVNIVGVVLNTFYVMIFLTYSVKKVTLIRQIVACMTGLVGLTYYLSLVIEKSEVLRYKLGLICTVWAMVGFASPLATLRTVIKTKSAESLPFPVIFSMFIVCLEWWIYGILIDDFFMKLTNLMGTLLAFAQLTLFIIYPVNSKISHTSYASLKSISKD